MNSSICYFAICYDLFCAKMTGFSPAHSFPEEIMLVLVLGFSSSLAVVALETYRSSRNFPHFLAEDVVVYHQVCLVFFFFLSLFNFCCASHCIAKLIAFFEETNYAYSCQ